MSSVTRTPGTSRASIRSPSDWRAFAQGPAPAPELGQGVLYRGQTHSISGPSDAGKSLFGAAIASHELSLGHRVLWIDFEQGGDRVIRRLLAFGADEAALLERFDFLGYPHGLPSLENIEALGADVDLVVVDANTGLLAALGVGSNADTDIELAYIEVLRPLAAMGAAVLIIDHVRKDKSERDGTAIGSSRKTGAVDVALTLDAIPPGFRPGLGGRAKIGVTRDRDGAVKACTFVVEADMDWRLEPSDASGGEAGWMPTFQMQRISIYLEAQHAPVSKNTIDQDVSGKSATTKRQALDLLIAKDYVTTTPGPRNAILCTSAKPYREPVGGSPSDLVPTSSDFVRDEVATTSSTSSPPYKGDEDEDEVAERAYAAHLVALEATEQAFLEEVS